MDDETQDETQDMADSTNQSDGTAASHHMESRVRQLEKDTTTIMSMLDRVTAVTHDLAKSQESIQHEIKESNHNNTVMFNKFHDVLAENRLATQEHAGVSLPNMLSGTKDVIRTAATIIIMFAAICAGVLFLASTRSDQAARAMGETVTTQLIDAEAQHTLLDTQSQINHALALQDRKDMHKDIDNITRWIEDQP